MIQTISRDEHLRKFDPQWFDYVLIDEVHRAGAHTYQKVMDYFHPQFMLGMTATPERTDGFNIYELFDYNVAYEIRLQEALDNNLLCPFMYFGVTDIEVNGQLLGEDASFNQLTSEARVEHILNKLDYYGHQGEKLRGLIFCSRKDEAHELSRLMNNRGLKTVALTGDDNENYREQTIRSLEHGTIDYILTVDIFNEGIDIPSVNQVVMLRNTQSSIIFIQQLGRGLRKHPSKEYVSVIDFIGNYRNNYLIPVALFGDDSMNKDNYRRDVRKSLLIHGLTTVNFEEIAQKKVFESIAKARLDDMKLLQENYVNLKNRLGRTPLLSDYILNHSMNPLAFFKKFKDYADVINKFDKDREKILLTAEEKKYLRFITFELANGKRQHELVLLDLLSRHAGSVSREQWVSRLEHLGLSSDQEVLTSALHVLDLSFLKAAERKQFGDTPLVSFSAGAYHLNEAIVSSLAHHAEFYQLFMDALQVGQLKQEEYPEIFTLGRKYSRRDVLKLLNIRKDEPPLNIGGYKIDSETNTCPIFITYHKSDDISDSIKYEDGFIDESTLQWFSKSGRTLASKDVETIMQSGRNGLRIELFVIKNDAEGGDFYYLGKLTYMDKSAREVIQPKSGKHVVSMRFKLETPVEPSLYRYITQE